MRLERRGWGAALAIAAALIAGRAVAQSSAAGDNGLHGRLFLQDSGLFSTSDSVQAALGAQNANEALGDLRLIWSPSWGRWSLDVANVVTVEAGPPVRIAQTEQGLIPEPPSTLFDLTGVIARGDQFIATDTIDRLSVSYSTPEWVVRVGRQAITWGSGLVFRPMDLFDPFSPTATDTEYKPGVGMLYVQRLFADGADAQLIVAPRPAVYGGPVEASASSFALHVHTTIGGHATTLLLASDHGDWVAGIGVNGALGGATWNLEVVPTILRGGGTRVSGVANISDAVTVAGKNATVFAEYYHNGFGVLGPAALTQLPADLLDRLERGQVFTIRRDYLAAGLTLEATPLLTISPSLIANLNDGGVIGLIAATWSLSDNLVLVAGAQTPAGRKGTEYGGTPLTPGSPVLLAPPDQIYVQLRRYF